MEMIRKIFLVLAIFGTARLSEAFRGKDCGTKAECIPLHSCPYKAQLIETRVQENIKKVKNSICAYNYQRGYALVCCPLPESKAVEAAGGTAKAAARQKRLCGIPSTIDKIYGGAPAPIGAYPWMAAMAYKEPGKPNLRFLCAGSLISARYVLTAAHCVDKGALGPIELAAIHLGDWNLSTEKDCQTTTKGQKCAPPHLVVKAEEVIIHPDYNKRAVNSDDIALVRIDSTMDFKKTKAYVRPVCLPPSGFNPRIFAGRRTPIAAGWGLTEHKNYSNILLRVSVPITDDESCRAHYSSQYVNKQLCIGGKGGFDTCSGDSGGPLVLAGPNGPPFLQIGIVSYGFLPCGIEKRPGVYTSVGEYVDWINQNIKP